MGINVCVWYIDLHLCVRRVSMIAVIPYIRKTISVIVFAYAICQCVWYILLQTWCANTSSRRTPPMNSLISMPVSLFMSSACIFHTRLLKVTIKCKPKPGFSGMPRLRHIYSDQLCNYYDNALLDLEVAICSPWFYVHLPLAQEVPCLSHSFWTACYSRASTWQHRMPWIFKTITAS